MAVKRDRAARRRHAERVASGLAEICARGGLSAAALRVAVGGRRIAAADFGLRRLEPPRALRPDDLFDAASLTKPFVATLALRLDARGELPLRLAIGEVLRGARPELARKRVESLLRHRSGLAAWYPLESLVGRGPRADAETGLSVEEALAWFAERAPLGASPGTYSDLGYLLWGLLAERATGRRLFRLLRREVLAPLGIASEVAERPAAARAVECALDGARELELAAALGLALRRPPAVHRGVPQDGNARFAGRACGHAGLFVSAEALLALGAEWLKPGRLLDEEQVARAVGGPRGPYALGWARRSRNGSSGLGLSRAAFGHAGFTGGSLWIDPSRDLAIALLAHRRSTATDLNPLRRGLHRTWTREIDGGARRSVTRVR